MSSSQHYVQSPPPPPPPTPVSLHIPQQHFSSTVTSAPTTFAHFNFETDPAKFTTQTAQLPVPEAVPAPIPAPPMSSGQLPRPATPQVPPQPPFTGAYGCPDVDPHSASNRYRTLTRNQWSTGLRGLHILMCPSCLAKFKADREICMTPEGQTLTLNICFDCVRRNRWARFEFKPPVNPTPQTENQCK